jgi:xanthine/CO dehydrogenase XdhC/CoxF family maturation factor
MLSSATDILKMAEARRHEGRGVAIATAVEPWAAPVTVGSHLVINEHTNFLGAVSGGCIEGAVLTEAPGVIADGIPRMLEFGVANEPALRGCRAEGRSGYTWGRWTKMFDFSLSLPFVATRPGR